MSELGLLEEALIPKARSEVSAGRQGLETQLYRVQWTSEGRKDKDLLSCLGEIVDGIVTNLFCCSMLQPCHLDILPELAVSPLPPTHTQTHTHREIKEEAGLNSRKMLCHVSPSIAAAHQHRKPSLIHE